eukprot:CAMPEP_0205920698 /NCGR_PEP_ID=MMETSP1325-20131115/11607_1 /ASSEMBLY_ACC=CAM_ASM_000708 /TAXON_ID=236786 /ORGANISM="Florenciella sp., Strain RCC1007" /LENGTH=361 /DNA_ID=CAMNT_0053288411 /DNA_START=20 /DNA_END=1105 /DNA_ORIENTATION=+
MPGLTVTAMEREEMRIAAIRKRMSERASRNQNPRMRVIGVDVAGLDAQIAEKKAMHHDNKADEKLQVQREQFINMMIEQREQEELETKRKEAAALKETWNEQLAAPKNQVAKMADPVKPEECGLSALQRFNGEDRSKYSRQRLQKEQVKSWTKQQMAERQAKANEEVDEMKRYAQYLVMIGDRRAQLEAEEGGDVKKRAMFLKEQNLALAEEVAAIKAAEVEAEKSARDAEIEFSMNDPFLCEDTSVALAADGRIRRDHFKGFSKDQTMTFYQENEKMIAAKAGAGSQEDLEWSAHQQHVRNILDVEDAQLKAQARDINLAHRKMLEEQMQSERARKQEAAAERFGKLDDSFYENFGCSHR